MNVTDQNYDIRFQGSIISVDLSNTPRYSIKPDHEGPLQYNDLQRLIDFLNIHHGKYRSIDKTGKIFVTDDQFIN